MRAFASSFAVAQAGTQPNARVSFPRQTTLCLISGRSSAGVAGIPPAQNAHVGSFGDTITVTVTF